MIIDFHAHIYPDHLAAKTVVEVRERSRIESYSNGTLEGLLTSMNNAGIDLSLVSSVATKPEQVERIHQWLAGIKNPQIVTLATMHPDLSVDPYHLKNLKTLGFKGFKIHPDYQNVYPDETRMYPFYEAAQKEGLFILFHAGLDRGLRDPIHGSPKRIARVKKDFPGLILIAAHLGGEQVYEETEEYLLGQDIYLDTSFVLQKIPLKIVERILKRHPIDRILFGTDSPWTDQASELKFFTSLPFLSEGEKEMILGGNASRLLALS